MPGLTAAQLVSLACQKAKVPGFTLQAGQLLNMVLSDLAQTYDFGLSTTSINFNFDTTLGSGPIVLPADFLRVKPQGMFFNYSGVPYMLIAVELQEYDALVQQSGIANFPEFYAVDFQYVDTLGYPVMYVWPPPSGAYPVTLRYFKQPDNIPTPETSAVVPWFPNQKTLLQYLTAALCDIADDDRADGFELKAELALNKYLKMKDDPEGKAKTISLDRRQFGKSFNRLPNTKTIGW